MKREGSPQTEKLISKPKGEDVKQREIIKRREAMDEYRRAADNVIKSGNELMKAEHDPDGKNPKEYHTSKHPESLYGRAEIMSDIFGLPLERKKLVQVEISYHDTIINIDTPPPYNPEDPKSIVAMAKRHRGARDGDFPKGKDGNEALSAKKMEEAMLKENKKAGREIFSKEAIATGVFAVETTYPDVSGGPNFEGAPFKEDPFYEKIVANNPHVGEIIEDLEKNSITKGIKFWQPHLERPMEKGEKIPEEVLIMAMADLGGCGMIKPKEFTEEGDSEFRELVINLKENLQKLLNEDDEATKLARVEALKAMQNWLQTQASFVVWQMLRFEKTLLLLEQNGQLKLGHKEKLRNAFSNFDKNIKESVARVDRVKKEILKKDEKEAFRYLAKEMNFKV